ncbi:hypothetical protein [Nonomuraea sp. NPDC049758]|uniref:hypothetical protein n=1 Tax=Nonomuraea sp. NPDC049758 TaxID=3154360 RepID=UPI003414905D
MFGVPVEATAEQAAVAACRTFMAIRRQPSLAARLAALEEQVAESRDRQQVSSAPAKIRQLTDHTRRDAADE